mmetsp:Transcript_23830/g.77670  ORF Transcript_23830/g.77670 Transcript_23830/m.77670 type:complete len:274 (+) Transcript_23830:517-1338(+)
MQGVLHRLLVRARRRHRRLEQKDAQEALVGVKGAWHGRRRPREALLPQKVLHVGDLPRERRLVREDTDAAGAVVGVVVEPDRLLHKLDREPEPRGVADDEVDSAGLQRGRAPEVHLLSLERRSHLRRAPEVGQRPVAEGVEREVLRGARRPRVGRVEQRVQVAGEALHVKPGECDAVRQARRLLDAGGEGARLDRDDVAMKSRRQVMLERQRALWHRLELKPGSDAKVHCPDAQAVRVIHDPVGAARRGVQQEGKHGVTVAASTVAASVGESV